MSFLNFLHQGSKRIRDLVNSEAPEVMSDAGSGSSWRMEEMSPTDDQHLTNVSAADSDDPLSLLKVLLEEYRHLLQHLPTGMLVAPSFHTLLEWHGSIHIMDGFYKGGVFKFVINIPVDYPASGPTVYFFNAVFHPLVDPQTGKLDISIAFPTWKPGRDYIVLVLAFIKKIFFKRELNSFLTSLPRAEFERSCDDCVAESLRLVYVCHPNSPFPFTPVRPSIKGVDEGNPDEISTIDVIKDFLEHIPREAPLEKQSTILDDWLVSTFIPNLKREDAT